MNSGRLLYDREGVNIGGRPSRARLARTISRAVRVTLCNNPAPSNKNKKEEVQVVSGRVEVGEGFEVRKFWGWEVIYGSWKV